MSNFKEIYPQKNFREDLHRMDSLGEDNYEVWAYNGEPDYAPLSSDYAYELIRNTKMASGSNITISDAINMPIESLKIYGESHYSISGDYINLSYIEANGTQYINPMIATPADTYWEVKFSLTQLKGTSNADYNMVIGVNSKPQIAGYINGWSVGNAGTTALGAPIIGQIYTASWNQDGLGSVYINGQNTNLKRTGSITPYICNPSSQYGGSYVRIYEVKYIARANDEILYHFIPCFQKNTGKVGLYEKQHNVFYQNAGSGEFIKGPEIGEPTITSPLDLLNVGTYNISTGWWETRINNDLILEQEQPLCSLGDEYKDLYDDGVLYYKTQYKRLLNTLNWQIDNTYSNDSVLVVSLFMSDAIKQTDMIYCTHFTPSIDMTQPNHIKLDNQRFYLTMDRNIVHNLNEFIQWLGNNNVVVIYKRKGVKKVLVEPYILLYTYDGTTNISNDQNAEMEIEYRVAPNARVWKKQEDGTFIELTS